MGDIATVLAIGSIVTAGATAATQIYSSQAAANAYEYQEAIAKQEAEFAKKQTKLELKEHRENLKKLLGRQAVIAGASGFVSSSGAPLSVLGETAKQAKLDEEIIKMRGNINVWRALAEGELAGKQAGYMRTAGYLQAGTTLLNEATRFDYRNLFGGESPLTQKNLTPRQKLLGV